MLCCHEVEGVGRESHSCWAPPVSCLVSFPPLLQQECGWVWTCPPQEHVCRQPHSPFTRMLVTVRPCQQALSILEPSGLSSMCPLPGRLCVDISDTPVELLCTRLPQPCGTAGLFWMPFPLSFPFYFWRLEGTPGL